MYTLNIDLWATNLELPVDSLDSWLAQVETHLAQTQACGGRLLVMPEFACMQWLSFAPPSLRLDQQVNWLASISGQALEALRSISVRYGVALLPGTMPFAQQTGPDTAPRHCNRAWFISQDGRLFSQDKLFLTPSEQNPAAWMLYAGDRINVIEWEGLKIAIVICLDLECTALFERLGRLDLDLILAPAKTDMLSGYYRVFGCAKARAIELQTPVCVVGAVGTALGHPAYDTVVGGAAAFLPCEASLGFTGIAAELAPQSAASGFSPLLRISELPVGRCREIRHGAAEAEVWPGAWTADHIQLVSPAPA